MDIDETSPDPSDPPPPPDPSPSTPPNRPTAAAVGGVNRPSEVTTSLTPAGPSNSPPKPGNGLSYNIRHYTRNPIEPGSADKAQIDLHTAYMRWRLSGFTIGELQDAGCWHDPNAIPSDLSRIGCMHPIYWYSKWQTGDECEDIGHGVEGKWDMLGNKAVQDALKPSLCLASLLLTHSATWTWFDALLFSPRKEVTPARPEDNKDGCDPKSRYYRIFEFRARDPASVQASQESFETYAASLEARVRYFVKSSVLRSLTLGLEKMAYGWHVPSIQTVEVNGVLTETYNGMVNMSSETLLPLLRNDLTTSERLVQQFCVAKTLVHETIHAFGKYIQTQLPNVPTVGPEPFFEDEAISELGRSWENACFGGQLDHIYIRDKSTLHEPSLGQVIWSWPNYHHFGDGKATKPTWTRYRYHEQFADGSVARKWVMPMFFIQNIQQLSYWTVHVPKYGVDALKSERILGYGMVKGKKNVSLLCDSDARFDHVAKRVFPKREGSTVSDRQKDFMAELHACNVINAESVRVAMRHRDCLADIKAGVHVVVDQDELDQQKALLDKLLSEENSGPEIDNRGVLDELSLSKYPEIRFPASLALVRDSRVGVVRKSWLCNVVKDEGKALAEREGDLEKWASFVKTATDELQKLKKQEPQKRTREDDASGSQPNNKKVKGG